MEGGLIDLDIIILLMTRSSMARSIWQDLATVTFRDAMLNLLGLVLVWLHAQGCYTATSFKATCTCEASQRTFPQEQPCE